jgi:cytochrome c-type biogenesis protein CcmF
MLLNIQYIGEHLEPGQWGNLFIVIALATAFLSFISYLFGNFKKDQRLIRAGKIAYLLHFIFVILAGAVLFYILFQGYWEYDYVWKHTASYLPTKFIISAFWAGQEGSFLLWVFLEALLGVILLFTSRKWESYVMPVLAFGQFMLTTMVWGVRPLGIVLGKSPFMLMRNDPINAGVDFFKDPNYLSQIVDGNGINPLLENIWMITHPPLLFLGYAAAIIPFAFAIGALWKRDFKDWLKPAFPWMIVALSTLGGGILLGGAWAYESLTFGGFWAWDPVENASLIPWLVILAAMHMMILNRKQNHSYSLSFALVILGFVLVIYASYLTRSGVLGETSAHAFGNNGLAAQMVLIMFLTLAVSIGLYIKNYKLFPKISTDDFFSREFWMFIGAIILSLSAFQIFITTSIPVINTIFGTSLAPPLDRVAFYNKWQLSFGILIVLSIGISLLLKYGKNDLQAFLKRLGIAVLASIILFSFEVWFFQIVGIGILFLLFSVNFTLVASVDYFFRHHKGVYNFSNSISHLGFGLMMLGIVVAFSTSQIISTNTSRYDLGDSEMNRENQLLIQNEVKELGKYFVKYKSMYHEKNHIYYTLEFMSKDAEGNLQKEFDLHPSINVNSRMGNVYDPDTYHSFGKDVFTYISYADIKADLADEKTKTLMSKEIGSNDTLAVGPYFVQLDSMYVQQGEHGKISVDNVKIIARLALSQNFHDKQFIELAYNISDGIITHSDYYSEESGLTFSFDNIGKTPGRFLLKVSEKRFNYIVVKTTVFPYISIMWIGVLIMFIGLGISFYRNTKISLK